MESSRKGWRSRRWRSIFMKIAVQINKVLMEDDSLPAWMTHGPTVLCHKDLKKSNTVENYHPITCLTLT